MGTTIRPEVSVKNKYWIDKHRHYELKHFCLQYPRWKKLYIYLDNKTTISPKLYEVKGNSGKVDMTARIAIDKAYYLDKIDLAYSAIKRQEEELAELPFVEEPIMEEDIETEF